MAIREEGARPPDEQLVRGFSKLSAEEYHIVSRVLGMYGLQLHDIEADDTQPEEELSDASWKTKDEMTAYVKAVRPPSDERILNQSWNSILRMNSFVERIQTGVEPLRNDETQMYHRWIATGIQVKKVKPPIGNNPTPDPLYAVSLESVYESLRSGKFRRVYGLGDMAAFIWLTFALDTLPEEKRDLEWETKTSLLKSKREQ